MRTTPLVIFVSLQRIQAFILSVGEYSHCAFPCKRQGRVFDNFQGNELTNFTTGDPRFAEITTNTTTFRLYCIERAGPFYILGRTIDGVNEYTCIKDTRYDSDDIIRVLYRSEFQPYSGRPDICEVCNGVGMQVTGFVNNCEIVVPKDLGCNIPWHCPVVDPDKQVQCSTCEPYEHDDGLCCDKDDDSSESGEE